MNKIILSILLIVLALSIKSWWSTLIGFVNLNSDAIQGLEALVQLTITIIALLSAGLGYQEKKTNNLNKGSRITKIGEIETKSGNVIVGDVTINPSDKNERS